MFSPELPCHDESGDREIYRPPHPRGAPHESVDDSEVSHELQGRAASEQRIVGQRRVVEYAKVVPCTALSLNRLPLHTSAVRTIRDSNDASSLCNHYNAPGSG